MKTLQELVGQVVNISAGEDIEDDNGIHLNFYGTLEAPEEGYNRYYVRVLDNGYGAQGVGFHPDQVFEIRKMYREYRIQLKKVLNAPY